MKVGMDQSAPCKRAEFRWVGGFVISRVSHKLRILAGFKLERTSGWFHLNFDHVFSLRALVLPVIGQGCSASFRWG